jgi:hypothetical protein
VGVTPKCTLKARVNTAAEPAMEMPGRKVRHPCQRGEIERIGQMTADVVDHAVDARVVGVARARQRPPRVTSGPTPGLTKI